ncbi:Unknown protein [Striga hermonthica]|uniref:F-box protein n=1 Tax=Striga hermonthica TaxID=68872 RepID=A0A9N7NBR2_STRHE|nr:Unknown protein [Striga hermonthica]
MSLNLFAHAKSKFKSFLNLYKTPIIKKDESKFLVAQFGATGEVDKGFSHHSIISIKDELVRVEKHLEYPMAEGCHLPLSTCNGLLLLSVPESYELVTLETTKPTFKMTKPAGEALWNPTTREFKILPPAPSSFDKRCMKMFHGYFGFGFDSANKDYKDTWSLVPGSVSSLNDEKMRTLEIWVWDGSWSLVSNLTVPLFVGLESLVGTDELIFLDSIRRPMCFDCVTSRLKKIPGLPTSLGAHIFPFVESYAPLDRI